MGLHRPIDQKRRRRIFRNLRVVGQKCPIHLNPLTNQKGFTIMGKDILNIKWNETFKAGYYYTDFSNLTEKMKSDLVQGLSVQNSSYTCFEHTAFLRATVLVEGIACQMELTLGEVDPDNSENEAKSLLENIELEHLPVYIQL